MSSHPGISPRAFCRLEDEIIVLAKHLSNRQLLELADDFHAMLRERRSALIRYAPIVRIYAGQNDNRREVGSRR